jgi:crossover junction endodeoxyribonuclease RusA
MPGPDTLTFTVAGMAPAPQGSKRALGNGRMIESSKNVNPWRMLVAEAALATKAPLIKAPVRLSIVFLFLRPKGHYGRKGLKPSAPAYHHTRPDVDKLQRSTFDALTGTLIHDDSLIVGCTAEKRYCVGEEKPGAIITLIPLQ